MIRPTPYYVVDLDEVERCYRSIASAFSHGRVYYCVKACGEAPVLSRLASLGVIFEISSAAELKRVTDAGGNPVETICGLPVKSDTEVEKIWLGGVRQFVYDHVDELQRIESLAPDSNALVRLRPPAVASNDPFGMTMTEFRSAVAARVITASNTRGVTIDLRSNQAVEPLREAVALCRDVERCLNERRREPFVVNIGGNYRLPEEVGNCFYSSLADLTGSNWYGGPPNLQMEVGRSVVKFAGQLVTTVILVRRRVDRLDIFVDCGEPAGVSHAPVSVTCHRTSAIPPQTVTATFWGMTCGRMPLFEVELGFVPQIGDKLVLNGMGSYTICKQSDFHGWLRTPVVYTSIKQSSAQNIGLWDCPPHWMHPAKVQ